MARARRTCPLSLWERIRVRESPVGQSLKTLVRKSEHVDSAMGRELFSLLWERARVRDRPQPMRE
jgi:hypothetical protein